MKWTKDGDLKVARGSLGHYRISEWIDAQRGSIFTALFTGRGDTRKVIGEFSSLANAKAAAESYDGYRAS